MAKGLCIWDEVKHTEMGELSWIPQGAQYHYKGPCKREAGGSVREKDVTMEAEVKPRKAATSRRWKRQEMVLAGASRRHQPCPHLGFSPMRPISDS